MREARGFKTAWHDPRSERLVAQFSVDAIMAKPGRMGGVTPVLANPRLELWLDECSEEWFAALADEWDRLARAAKLHAGEWEIVLWKSGQPGVRIVSGAWRARTHAPGMDLFGPGERRGRAPLVSLYWKGPGRGVGFAVGGRSAEWPEFVRAAREAEAFFNQRKHDST